jgi:hypothetical protein
MRERSSSKGSNMAEVLNWQVKIFTSWKRYKKLIPAIAGITLLIALKQLGIDLPGFTSIVLDWLIGGATVFGVYQVKNDTNNTEAIVVNTQAKTTGSK